MMMFGGGGSRCGRADHGIGITENDNGGSFDDRGTGELDFGDEADRPTTSSYSLNLWIR